MNYSVYDAANGGFTYYQAPGPNINADFQTPSFRPTSPLGVPSTLAARPLPSGAQAVGHGAMPKGTIARPGGGLLWAGPGGSGGGVDPSGLGAFVPDNKQRAAVAAAAAVLVFLVADKATSSKVLSAILATGVGGYVYGFGALESAVVGILPP